MRVCVFSRVTQQVAIPAGLAAGATFSAKLPGSFRSTAEVTVPPGAKSGDVVDLRVPLSELGDLSKVGAFLCGVWCDVWLVQLACLQWA